MATKTYNVKLTPIDDIRPYERNPRINDQAVDAVAASLQEFGFRQPIVVDADGVIIAGHTRWKAAKQLGLAKVPVHVARDLTPEQIQAYRIADNRTGELAEWDFEILPIELAALREGGFDMDVLAFDEDELARLLNKGEGVTEGLTDPDAVPEPPDEAVTQPGDLWILGEHRLLCGDSAKEADLDRLLDGAVIDLLYCDPPYNVAVEPRSNNAIAAGLSSFSNTHHQGLDLARHPSKAKATHQKMRAKDRPLTNDFVTDADFDLMLAAWFQNAARVMKPWASFYIWGGYANLANYPKPIADAGLYFSQAVVWNKQHPVLTRKDMMGCFELAYYGWLPSKSVKGGHKFYGPNNATDLWNVKKIPPQQMEHLTAKPVELAVRAIQYSSLQGQNVLDHFAGSGSTLIGCEQTGRRCYTMEIDPLYADLVADRFQRFTGRPAILERTGKSPIPMKPRQENMR